MCRSERLCHTFRITSIRSAQSWVILTLLPRCLTHLSVQSPNLLSPKVHVGRGHKLWQTVGGPHSPPSKAAKSRLRWGLSRPVQTLNVCEIASCQSTSFLQGQNFRLLPYFLRSPGALCYSVLTLGRAIIFDSHDGSAMRGRSGINQRTWSGPQCEARKSRPDHPPRLGGRVAHGAAAQSAAAPHFLAAHNVLEFLLYKENSVALEREPSTPSPSSTTGQK